MKLAIMQPYFFPYLGYWQLVHAVDKFVVYDDVNYIKGGWINRNRILINGHPSYITVPLHQASPFKRICDTLLQPSMIWREKLVRTIDNTYRKAPGFAEVFPVVEEITRYETDSLSEYLTHQLRSLSTFLGITTEFVATSRCYGNSELSGQDRIIDICRREGAETYLNLPGGRQLYDAGAFAQEGITLQFIEPVLGPYKHGGSQFVPGLSILDVLMWNPVEDVRKMVATASCSS